MKEQKYFEENPLKPHLQFFADYTKNFTPTQYMQVGRYRFIPISHEKREQITQACLEIQNICLPTIKKLRNIQNISQLQEKVYLKMKKYEDIFNNCLAKARTPADGDVCSNQFVHNLTVDFKPKLQKILQEY